MKKTLLFVVFVTSLFVSTAHAQTCPGFPARGVQIIDALYVPALAQGGDEQRRQLTRAFVEQLAYEFPLDGWTWKSADSGRPPSKDSISRIVGGRLCNWDWQSGETRLRVVQAGTPGDDITGQNPIPVAGVNHLGAAPPPVVTPDPVPAPIPGVDLSSILKRLDGLKEQNEALYAQAERMFADEQARLAAHDARLEKHAAETKSFIETVGGFFTNKNTLAVIAGLVAGRFALPQ